jgi:hypothetical protein
MGTKEYCVFGSETCDLIREETSNVIVVAEHVILYRKQESIVDVAT